MKSYAVESSNVKAIAYDPNAKNLVVTFHSDASYLYENVEASLVGNLLFAESIGATFNDSIKQHKCTKQDK